MKFKLWRRCSVSAVVCAVTVAAQTKIDLRTQTKSVDFSGASATKPARMGVTLPASCGQGEFFFLTSAPAGQNVYGCSLANTWWLQGAAVAQSSLVPASLNNSGKLLSTDGINPVWQSVGGDVSGTPGSLTVNKLLGRSLSTTAPVDGQLLKFNAGTGKWEPIGLAGDVTGSPGALTVTAFLGRSLSTVSPADGQLLKFNGGTGKWEPIGLAGDVAGSPSALTVTGFLGRGLSTATPADGQVLKFNGGTGKWEPIGIAGDVTGSAGALTVTGLRGRGISSASPADGQLLKFNASTSVWEPVALNGDVTGAPGTLRVGALQGRGISTAVPGNGQLLSWSASTSAWIPSTLQEPPNYSGAFTAVSTVTIAGTQHNLNTANLIVTCYDNATPANVIEPGRVTVAPGTFNVTITFATAQSGNCVVNGSGSHAIGATVLTGTASLAFPTINNGACGAELTISVPGALPGNGVAPGWPALPAGFTGIMRVSANDTVAVRVCNFSGVNAALASVGYSATVVKSY